MNNVIMIVDDERHILNTCKRLLIDEPFNCVFFESPVEALQKLEQILPAVIISDQRMKEMSGISFLSQTKDKMPESVRVIMTGYADIESAILSINEGHVFRFLKKPWTDEEFRSEVLLALEYYKITSKLNFREIDVEPFTKQERLHGVLEMAAAVCHEFSQPLQVISGYCGMLNDIPDTIDDKETTQKHLSIIQEQVERLGELLLKVMTIKDYKTKPYTNDKCMVDIDNAACVKDFPFAQK